MRKKSVVWEFFDSLNGDNSKCVAVVCKLCDRKIKFCGNTTNLRSHLIQKHPLQWYKHENKPANSVEPSADEDSNMASPSLLGKRSKRRSTTSTTDNVRYSISINKASRTQENSLPTIEIQRVGEEHSVAENEVSLAQMKSERNDREDWLYDDYGNILKKLKSKRKGQRKMIREVTPPSRLYLKEPVISPVYFPSTPKDEYSAFGEYIAKKLRNLNSTPAKQNVQQLITTILWQAEFGAYKDIEGVKKILISSLQDTDTTETTETSHYVEINTESIETV